MATRTQHLLDLIAANPALDVKVRKVKKYIRTNIKAKIVPVDMGPQLNLTGEVYFYLKKNPTLSLIAEEIMVGLAKDGLFYSAQQIQNSLANLTRQGSIKRLDVTPTEIVVRGYNGNTKFSYKWSARLPYKGAPMLRHVRVNPGVTKVEVVGG